MAGLEFIREEWKHKVEHAAIVHDIMHCIASIRSAEGAGLKVASAVRVLVITYHITMSYRVCIYFKPQFALSPLLY